MSKWKERMIGAIVGVGLAMGGSIIAAPDVAYQAEKHGEVATHDVAVEVDRMVKIASWKGSLEDIDRICLRPREEKTLVSVRGKLYAPSSDLPHGVRIIKE